MPPILRHQIFQTRRKIWIWPTKLILVVLMTFSVRLSYLYTTLPGPWDGDDWRWNWAMYLWVLSNLT
jgi:hypothetical protein